MIGKLAVVLTALVAFGSQVARTQTVTVPAFYVATNGSDANPGTLEAPFLTLGRAQSAMQGSTTKTTYIRAGTYTPASVGGSCNYSQGDALILKTPADDGETWSYYPPDGYGSAIINGRAILNTGLGIGICSYANNLTVNGLHFENFQIYGIETNGSNPLIENNTINNITNTSVETSCIGVGDGADGKVINNAVTNCTTMGISNWPSTNGGADNLLIAHNYIYNVCTATSDCGGIYIEHTHNGTQTTQTGQIIQYNYVTTVSGGGRGTVIYLDDVSSNVTTTGNVMLSTDYVCYFIHGGSNNVATGNICDIGTLDSPANGPAFGECDSCSPAMSGNTWKHNIIVSNSSVTNQGAGYLCYAEPCQLTNGPNAHHNYGTGTINTRGDLPDPYPVYENPNFTSAWTYTLPSNSPVYGTLVSFPMQPANWGSAGFWGPPGFVIPQTGTPPSMVASTATLTTSPTSITSGQSSTLTWSSTNATSCTGTGFTASGTSGSASVSPTTNTTYSVTCGSASASATVIVGFLRRRR